MDRADYESAMINFLAQKENVRFAFEIADSIEAVKDALQLKFWHSLEVRVKEKLGILGEWECSLDSDEKLLRMNDCVGMILRPARRMHSLYLRPRIEQDEKAKVWYGIGWSKEVRELPGLKQIGALRDRLMEVGYDVENTYDGWWLGIKETTWNLREKKWDLRIAEGDTLEDGIAASFVELFEDAKKLLEEINQALAKATPKTQ